MKEYTYLQRVRIVKGFYKGQTGTVRMRFLKLPFIEREYEVLLDTGLDIEILESSLEEERKQ